MTTEYYIAEGYVEQGYFQRQVNAGTITFNSAITATFTVDIADDTGYFIPDYIADGYITGVKEFEATVNTTASLTILAGRLESAECAFDTLFTPTVVVQAIKNSFAVLDSAFTQTVAVQRFRDVVSDQTFTAELVIAFGNLQQAEASLSIAAAQTAAVGVIKQGASTQASAMSATITVIATKVGEITSTTTASMSVSLTGTIGFDITLETSIALSLQAARSRDYSSTQTASATQTTSAARTRATTSTQTAQTNLTCTISHIEGADIVLLPFSTLTLTSSIIRGFSVSLENTANLAADAVRIKQLSSELTADTALSINETFVTLFDSQVSSAFAVSAQAIEYKLRENDPTWPRPRNFTVDTATGYSSLIKKFGTHSFRADTITSSVQGYTGTFTFDYSEDWVIECWIYRSDNANKTGIEVNGIRMLYGGTYSGSDSFTQQIIGQNSTLFSQTDTITATPSGGWFHLAAVKTDNTISFYCAGTRFGTLTAPAANLLKTPAAYNLKIIVENNSGGTASYIDEASMRVGDTYGYSASSSSITPPTSARTDDIYGTTQFLIHFDEGSGIVAFDDWQNVYIFDEDFELTTQSTFTVSAGISADADAELSVAASQSVTGNFTVDNQAELASAATVSVTAESTKEFAVSISAAVSQTTVAEKITDVELSVSAQSTQTTVAVKTVSAVTDFDSIATQLAAVSKIGDFLVAMDVIAAQSTAVVKKVDPVFNFNAAASLTADGIIEVSGSSTMSAAFAVTTTALRIKDFDIDLLARANFACDPEFTTNGTANLTASATIDVTSTGTIDVIASLTSTATQTTQAVKTVLVDMDITATTTLSGEATRSGNISSEITASAAQTAAATRTRDIRIGYIGDRTPKTVSTFGNVAISTAQARFGAASALITDTGDYFTIPGDSNLYNGDFTVEMWLYASNLTSIPNGNIWDNRTSSSSGMYLYVSYGSIGLGEGINIKGLTSAGFNNSQWNHITLVRNGTNAKVFVNGVQKISATVTTTNYSNRTTYIGSTYTGSTPMRSYFDEVRLSSNARYTTGFTPSTTAFTSDGDVRALLHLDTDFSDDVGFDPGLEAFVTTLIVAAQVSDFFIPVDVTVSQTTVAVKTTDVVSTQSAQITQTATAGKLLATAVSTQPAEFTISVAAFVGLVGESTQTSTFTQSTVAVKTVDIVKTLTPSFNLFCKGSATFDGDVLQASLGTLTVIGAKVRFGTSDLTSTATQTTVVTRVRPGEVTVTAAMTALASVRDLRLDEIMYVIPGEIWVYDIISETRLYTIQQETRTYTVEGD